MRSFIVLMCTLYSFTVFAENKDNNHHQPSTFEVSPINSPVKGPTAKFSLKLPTGFEIDKIKVKLVNANDLKKDQRKFEEISVTGNELFVGIPKLSPGFYRLYVKVWDKKNKSEHDFKTKFHDFVRFVIDESLQVPMPDPKKNDSTIAGVDSDGDGIRDDIQRFINEEYSSSMKAKIGAKQMATLIQLDLLTTANKEQSIIVSTNALWAMACLRGVVGSRKASQISRDLRARFLNTKERLYANMKSNENFSGQAYKGIVGIEQISKCNFDPLTLSN